MDSYYIGEIRAFAFNFITPDWLPCYGQTIPLVQYQALAAVIGTIYGGDGKTTIGLPNLNGAAVVGQAPTAPFTTLGAFGGTETVTLNSTQLPSHTHNFQAFNRTTAMAAQVVNTPANNVYLTNATTTANPPLIAFGYANTYTSGAVLGANTLNITGVGGAHENRTPYVAMTYCICYNGIFPTRD